MSSWPPFSLSVSIVTFAPDLPLLCRVLRHLAVAMARAREGGALGRVELLLVDNGPGRALRPRLDELREAAGVTGAIDQLKLLEGHGNVGFGAGHNLALQAGHGDLHLILNPDVLMAPDALHQALDFLSLHPETGLLAPAVRDGQGRVQYLCKRYPSVLDLFLRGFTPFFIRRLFHRRLGRYELRDRIGDRVVWDVPIVSGCFMLFRRPVLKALQGFDPDYFLYFEDFDLSLRAGRVTRIVYVPQVRVVHLGGYAARKGWRHIRLFMASAFVFFNRHGWKWL